jgi:GTP-binding protein Era
MKIKDKIKNYKSGYVCIVGKTNVGKSSFLNKILKEKISIVSNKFQTTRKKITGILNLIDAQIIFVDTPGFHSRENKLSDIMIKSINREIIRSDLILFMIDPNLNDLDFKLFDQINKFNKKKILLINKIDILNKEKINNINNIKDKFNK